MSIRKLSEAIGKAAREARRALGLTQQDVAERIGINPEFYGRIERGRAFPSVVTLVRMIDVLGISADALMGMPHESSAPSTRRRRRRKQSLDPELRRLVRILRRASQSTIDRVIMVVDQIGISDDGEDEEGEGGTG